MLAPLYRDRKDKKSDENVQFTEFLQLLGQYEELSSQLSAGMIPHNGIVPAIQLKRTTLAEKIAAAPDGSQQEMELIALLPVLDIEEQRAKDLWKTFENVVDAIAGSDYQGRHFKHYKKENTFEYKVERGQLRDYLIESALNDLKFT